MPRTYEEKLELWRKRGGGDLEGDLASGAVALLDTRWIIRHADTGGVLTHRQALPKDAFLSFADLVEAICEDVDWLPVAVVSHPWLSKDHPDPRGANLGRVARALKALLDDGERLGVFWDFGSLHHHPDPANGVVRTEEQNALFKQGLRGPGGLNALCSHPYTWMLQLTSALWMAEDGHKAEDQAEGTKYFARGFCFFESSLASLTKNSQLSLDLGLMRDGKEYDRESLIVDCTESGGRHPPLLPSAFAAELETKSFTNGKDDKPLVNWLYEAAFEEQFGKATVLFYGDLGWGDTEAAQVAEVLASGAAPRLEKLYLCRNQIGDVGCCALAAALKEQGAAPRLEELDLGANDIGDEGLQVLATALSEGAAPSLKSLHVGRKLAQLDAEGTRRGISVHLSLPSEINLPGTPNISKAAALNDQPQGIDRFGYRPYAEALVAMLLTATPPTCIGVYAKWGSGKSFFISLLKREFDKQSRPDDAGLLPPDYAELQDDKRTGELRQWFEVGSGRKEPRPHAKQAAAAAAKEEEESKWWRWCSCSWLAIDVTTLLGGVLGGVTTFLGESTPYWVTTLELVLEDTFQLVEHGSTLSMRLLLPLRLIYWALFVPLFVALKHCAEKLFGCILLACCLPPVFLERYFGHWEYYCDEFKGGLERLFKGTHGLAGCICCCCRGRKYEYSRASAEPDVEAPRPSTKEYIFVDFNAWEYSASDELWAGLIRAMYRKVELRIEAEAAPAGGPGHFKRRWRARQALTALKKQHGKYGLLFRALLLVLLFAAAITFLVLELTGAFMITKFIASAVNSVSGIIGTAAAAVGALLAAVPAIGLGVQSARESGQSRGDKIFKEAKSVKDELGFLATVKNELNELFDFLTDVFKEETGRELIIVAFVDDLDRCLKGRNVKALEAMQLILSVPGAPMIAFLAIDSRVVVASIEETFGAVLRDAHISGWEYLDKIVQIPFSLPEPPPEKVHRLVMRTLEGAGASQEAVERRIDAFVEVLQQLKADGDSYYVSISAANERKMLKPDAIIGLWKGGGSVASKILQMANKLGDFARSQAILGRKIGGIEGREIMYRAINAVLSPGSSDSVSFMTKAQARNFEAARRAAEARRLEEAAETSQAAETSHKAKEEPVAQVAERIEVAQQEAEVDGGARAAMELFARFEGLQQKPLVQQHEMDVFRRMCLVLESNPRRLKRVLQIYTLIAEVAKRQPQAEDNLATIDKLPGWHDFSCKLVKWTCLCELYPYRMSLLVLILKDMEQRATMNRLVELRETRAVSIDQADTEASQLFRYRRKSEQSEQPFLLDMNTEANYISTFYNMHVEGVLYSHKLSERMLRLDGDAELFQTMLLLPAPAPSPAQGTGDRFVDISVGDIIGPRMPDEVPGNKAVKLAMKDEKETGIYQRDSNLSLLSYSFNLNPSLRVQLAGEMALALSAEAELQTADGTSAIAQPQAAAAVEKKASGSDAVANQRKVGPSSSPLGQWF